MGILEIIDGILELALSWRFYLCVLIGCVLGGLILNSISEPIIAWILAGAAFLTSFVTGWRWDNSTKF